MQQLAVFLFSNFETLDVFGPVEVFGRLKELFKINFYSYSGGMVSNEHGISIESQPLSLIVNGTDIILIPGGHGTRQVANDGDVIDIVATVCETSKHVLTVCTGTAILAKTGQLDGKRATSNKKAFDWVTQSSDKVTWIREARWVVDGKFYTSSGVSAGIDMALGYLSDHYGKDLARTVAKDIEYRWNDDKDFDEFSVL